MLQLIQKASLFVSDFYKNKGSAKLIYHNYHHVLSLLKRANTLFEEEQISGSNMLTVQFALLFSETGYCSDYANPFEKSKTILNDFFKIEDIDTLLQQQMIACIDAIANKDPKNKLEEITLDIYHSDYGTKKFLKQSAILKKEMDALSKSQLLDEEWLNYQIKLLTNHRFYKDYAIREWQGRKQKNLAKLLDEKAKKAKVAHREKTKAYYKQKFKDESPERGIQTLYRVALRNHIKLSDIADTKANILLSVNAIIISLVLANLISKLDNPSNRYLILPTIIFVTFSIISMIMSIKATQPDITRGEFSEKDLKDKNVNLAFFGNFHKIELDRYQRAFKNLIKNRDDVYTTLTTDLYFLGSVLDSKYRLLRYTYLVFMIGIIISVITFALAFIYRNSITL